MELLEMKPPDLKPVIKCPGGKRQLISEILTNLPGDFAEGYSTYVEPFVGGGAVFFEVARQFPNKKMIINDVNSDITNVYSSIKCNLKDLIFGLKEYDNYKNDKKEFYEIRERFNALKGLQDPHQASRFMFLNKTGFNGLIRYNRKGLLNVPFGSYKNPKIFDQDHLSLISNLFNSRRVTILNEDFSRVIWNTMFSAKVPSSVFFYLDPPYDATNETSNFADYTPQGFSKADHLRLMADLKLIDSYGGKFLLSGANTEFMKKTFQDYNIVTIKARRSINSNKRKRGKINELLIKNYE